MLDDGGLEEVFMEVLVVPLHLLVKMNTEKALLLLTCMIPHKKINMARRHDH